MVASQSEFGLLSRRSKTKGSVGHGSFHPVPFGFCFVYEKLRKLAREDQLAVKPTPVPLTLVNSIKVCAGTASRTSSAILKFESYQAA